MSGWNRFAVTRWHLLTGEYPPAPGGVSDYTRQLAQGLSDRGEAVDVWAPDRRRDRAARSRGSSFIDSPRSVRGDWPELGENVGALGKARPQRLLVQYVPQAFGIRGMNVPLVRWLTRLPVELWVQFHEVALAWEWRARPRHQVIAIVQRWMAHTLARRADRVFVSVEGWRKQLGTLGARATWLPIPSNVPVTVSDFAVARVRKELGAGPWIGHFGTYGALIRRDLAPALLEVADRNASARFLLLGRGATRFAQDLGLGDRVKFLEGLPGDAISAHLSACDVLIQPFPDGISARRTSAMAGLALGVPMVTTEGHLTDSVWPDSGAVALAPAGDTAAIAGHALDLLDEPSKARALGERGARLYLERFSIERTMEILASSTTGPTRLGRARPVGSREHS